MLTVYFKLSLPCHFYLPQQHVSIWQEQKLILSQPSSKYDEKNFPRIYENCYVWHELQEWNGMGIRSLGNIQFLMTLIRCLNEAGLVAGRNGGGGSEWSKFFHCHYFSFPKDIANGKLSFIRFFCRAASILHSNVYNLIKLYDKQRPQHPTLPDIIFTKRLSQKSMEEQKKNRKKTTKKK